MEKSGEQLKEFAQALATAQGKIKIALKNAENPFFKRKYADMASVYEACRSALSENGIAVIQIPSTSGNCVEVETILMHSSGQWISGKLAIAVKEPTPQLIGTIITYLCRYALKSMVGVAAEGEEDDGNDASGKGSAAGKNPKDIKPSTPAKPGTKARFDS